MRNNKLLFLTLHTFSLTGGIEKVCCCLAKVWGDLKFDFKLYALYDKQETLDSRYLESTNFAGMGGNKMLFAIRSIWRGSQSNLVILSHINLLLFAWLIKLISPRTKVIMLAHGIEVWRPLSAWKLKFLRTHTEIWAVSKFTAESLTKMHQIDADRIKVLNNCLDPYFPIVTDFNKPERLLNKLRLSENQPTLFTLTRLSSKESYKGHDRVLHAMAQLRTQLPNLHYVLAGKADEAELARIKDMINALHLNGQVSLVGFLPDEELIDYFRLGDVFIMPSTKEGFGIVFIEAAACGSKTIGGNVDGSVDALLNGDLGTLVNPDNIEEIAAAIEKNLGRESVEAKIQSLCIENFSYAKYVQKIKILLNSFIDQ